MHHINIAFPEHSNEINVIALKKKSLTFLSFILIDFMHAIRNVGLFNSHPNKMSTALRVETCFREKKMNNISYNCTHVILNEFH